MSEAADNLHDVVAASPDVREANGRGGWVTAANLVACGQVVATLLAAGWTFFLYVEFGRTERRLASDLAQLELLKVEREVEELTTLKLTPTHAFEIRDLGPVRRLPDSPDSPREIVPIAAETVHGPADEPHAFLVSYRYEFENTGATENEVTYVVVHAYTAPRVVPAAGEAVRINLPLESGDVAWRHRLSHGCLATSAFKDGLKFKTPHDDTLRFPFREGSGGTGTLAAGESSSGSVEFVVSAMPGEFVAVHTQIGLNGGGTAEDRWQLDLWETLHDDDPQLDEPADPADVPDRRALFGDPWRMRR